MIVRTSMRAAIERQIGVQLPDDMWDFMVERRFVGDVALAEEADLRHAVKAARDLLRLSGVRHSRRPVRKRSDPVETEIAITVLLVAEAEKWPEVVVSREEVGRLIPWDALASWIRSQAAIERRQGLPVSGEMVYALPDDQWVHRIPISQGGLLEQIRDTSASLRLHYGWDEAQASVWLLTGVAPLLSQLEADRIIRSAGYTATDRIVLRIDPTVPASRVAEFYLKARGRHVGRVVSARHARLAAFIAERGSEPWRERMEVWNRLHPQWRYDHSSNMIRDAASARNLLLRRR